VEPVFRRYPNMPISVSGNGVSEPWSPKTKMVNDTVRVQYLKDHINHLCKAIREDKVPVSRPPDSI
jgi:beta-glucosidase/6-phospho-beta-glucosidase/beta-galactosidase